MRPWRVLRSVCLRHRVNIIIVLCALISVLYFFGFRSSVRTDTTFEIGPGATVSGVAAEIKELRLIKSEDEFKMLIAGFGGTVQRGVYDIPRGTSALRIAKMFARGEVAATIIVIPEGLTVRQIYAMLEGNEWLRGEIVCAGSPTPPPHREGGGREATGGGLVKDSVKAPPSQASPDSPLPMGGARALTRECYRDGDLFPDTYRVAKGTPRAALLDLMRKKMQEIERGWIASGKHLPAPLKNWNDVVTLASIVQKETPRVSEMPTVASVYLNRLRKKMRLQADPTVVYAITDKLGDMQGAALYESHLKIDHPFNTYTNYGLPPHPIANVGRDAIRAVLNPAATNYYFFVADGTGGHAFAKDFDEHTANRARWREIKNAR